MKKKFANRVEQQRAWREANRSRIRQKAKDWRELHKEEANLKAKQWRDANRKKIAETNKRILQNKDPIERALHHIKKRANASGIAFSLTPADLVIPTHCPVLGIELKPFGSQGRWQPNSSSLDRIDNSKGYEPGNVQIISYRANRIKNDATPEELMKMALWMSK